MCANIKNVLIAPMAYQLHLIPPILTVQPRKRVGCAINVRLRTQVQYGILPSTVLSLESLVRILTPLSSGSLVV